MTSNPKPEREKCPHDGHLLDRAGKCWYCGGIYPAGKPALMVVEAEPKVEGEKSMESVEATLSLVKPDGTETEPVPYNKFVKTCNDIIRRGVDPETGEVHTEPYQPTLDDTLFGPYQVVSVRVNFSGADSLTLEQISAYTDGRGLKPGARVEVTLAGYVCGAGLKFCKGGESKEASLNIALDDLLLLRLDPVYEDEADPEPEDEEDREWSDD